MLLQNADHSDIIEITETGKSDMEVRNSQRSEDMSYFGLADMNSANTLFSSLNNNFSIGGSAGSGNILAEYASIRSGSYHKLLKAYYSDTGKSAVSDIVNPSTSTSKDSTKQLSKMENAAESLKESADALMTRGTKDVFKQTTITKEDGTTSKEYQKDAIYNKVKSFIDDYNSVVDVTEESNTKSIARASAQMIQLTNANKRLLDDIGISINKDDTLSIDKDTFMAADMNKVKSLFNGAGSYGYNVGVKASMIDYYAQNEASKANTYGSSGKYNYNYSYGSNYSNYI